MIMEFVDRFEINKRRLEEKLRLKHPRSYTELVRATIETITSKEYDAFAIDPERIHVIDDGNYQGTLVFVIPIRGYQPSDYWYVKVSYGSCSGCDTLQGIRDYMDDPPTEEQVKDYLTLCLHIVQGLKKME